MWDPSNFPRNSSFIVHRSSFLFAARPTASYGLVQIVGRPAHSPGPTSVPPQGRTTPRPCSARRTHGGRIESQAEPIPGYKLIERLGGGGFGEVWKCEAPGGLHKAVKFVFGDLSAAVSDSVTDHGDDGHRAKQELKALSRVKTVRHPFILSLERYDIIDGQLIIIMELADRNLWDRFKECRAQGLPGIPRDELLGYMDEAAEGAGPDEQHVPAAAPRHQAAEPLPRLPARQGGRLRPGQGPRRRPGVGDGRRHAGLRRPRNLRRLGQPLQRSIQSGHLLSGAAHRPPAVQRCQRPSADRAAPPGRPRRLAAAAGRPAGHRPGAGQEPGRPPPDVPGHGPAAAPGRPSSRRSGKPLRALTRLGSPGRSASSARPGRDARARPGAAQHVPGGRHRQHPPRRGRLPPRPDALHPRPRRGRPPGVRRLGSQGPARSARRRRLVPRAGRRRRRHGHDRPAAAARGPAPPLRLRVAGAAPPPAAARHRPRGGAVGDGRTRGCRPVRRRRAADAAQPAQLLPPAARRPAPLRQLAQPTDALPHPALGR